MNLDEETQPMSSKQQKPDSELARPVSHVLGDGLVKWIGGLALAAALAFGGWMTSMWSTQNTLAQKSAEVSFKLDVLNEQLAETKRNTIDAEAQARDNARRLDRIEATRFTDQDAAKAIAPLIHRLDRLESKQPDRR